MRVFHADVRAVTEEHLTLADPVVRHDGLPQGEVTYTLGPVIQSGRAVFGASSDGSKWVCDDLTSEFAITTHRIALRDPWLCRWVQMVDALDLPWDEPDGSTVTAHVAYLPDAGRRLFFIDPTTFLQVNGSRAGFAVGYRFGVVVESEDGDVLHSHSNLTGGAALTMAALYLARYGERPGAVSDSRLVGS